MYEKNPNQQKWGAINNESGCLPGVLLLYLPFYSVFIIIVSTAANFW